MVDITGTFPEGFNADKFKHAAPAPAYDNENPRAAFMDEVKDYGFTDTSTRTLPPTPERIGDIVRCTAPDDKKGKKSGWYIYNEFEDGYRPGAFVGVGVFGSWRGNPEKVVWSSKRREAMSTS